MPNTRLLQQLEFIREIDKLKYIFRKSRLFGSDRHENDAEHSWHLAMMAVVLEEHAIAPVSLLRVIKMLLIHDIVEIDAGDTFLYDTTKDHNNTEEELVAANRIFGILPEDQRDEFIKIWQEFEAGESADARFAKALDRLEPVMQNASNGGGTWQEFDVPKEKVLNKIQGISRGSDTLWAYTQQLLDKCVADGLLKA
ncbi:HD domain-containing protein [Marinoscillum furvescens]|uniref:Putative hydrolase of HD superfamily n=1 Tax=Marinoscillum furvescens DSM 4134 TaxID=1122208 RepID=A0A3D9KY10_MARFU|nr:HD domain-containing protein [Marinoscillum furvescens]RED93852.1 putative hydrolase of HD superfamily [Marinoscillum furvescens DSM 4134]